MALASLVFFLKVRREKVIFEKAKAALFFFSSQR